jgi:hypothetical protein
MSTSAQLKEALQLGALSVAELCVWLDCPRPTVTTWLRGAEPRPLNREKVLRRLVLLHEAISKTPYPFIPEELTLTKRRVFLLKKKSEFVRNNRNDIG